jgi:hypothetical protein
MIVGASFRGFAAMLVGRYPPKNLFAVAPEPSLLQSFSNHKYL